MKDVFSVGGLLEAENHSVGSTSASQTGKRTWVERESRVRGAGAAGPPAQSASDACRPSTQTVTQAS